MPPTTPHHPPSQTFHELEQSSELHTTRQQLAAEFASEGWHKVDDRAPTDPPVDSGVLAVRDALLGSSATWLITCDGSYAAGPTQVELCKQCFFASAYIHRAVLTRTAAGLLSNPIVWHVNMSTIVPPLPLH